MRKVTKALILLMMTILVASSVTAVNAIANDTLEGLPALGTQIGEFMSNLAPGLGAFIVVISILSGIAGLVTAIIVLIKSKARV